MRALPDRREVPAAGEPGTGLGAGAGGRAGGRGRCTTGLRERLAQLPLETPDGGFGVGAGGAVPAAVRGSPACTCGASERDHRVQVRRCGAGGVQTQVLFGRDGRGRVVKQRLLCRGEAEGRAAGVGGAPIGEVEAGRAEAVAALDVTVGVVLAPRVVGVDGHQVHGHSRKITPRANSVK